MKEIQLIIKAYEDSRLMDLKSVLVTLVHLEGSSFRRPGARMLVTEDGHMTGTISGGCLEGDALRKALQVMNQQETRLVTYDTTDEDDASIGAQLGCAGIIQVLMEPLNKEWNTIEALKLAAGKRQSFVMVTCFSLTDKKNYPHSTRLVLTDKELYPAFPKQEVSAALTEDATIALQEKKSAFRQYQEGEMEVTAFIEFIQPPINMVVLGAGNDVIPLVEIADTLGWHSVVMDGRPALAKKERFSPSCQVLVARPEQVLEQVDIDDRTVFVLMTHNYNYDLAMVRSLIRTPAFYIGLLGPKKKMDQMLEALEEEGIRPDITQLGRIYNPVGLHLGAETPEEIALSIIAEIQAVLTGKNGQSLRTLSSTIHPRTIIQITEKKIN